MTTRSRTAGQRPLRRREGRPRFYTRRKVCAFCVDHVEVIDYKDIGRLQRYLSDRARIDPRRKTGTCSKHQRALATALKRARHLALLPFVAAHLRGTGEIARPRPAAAQSAPAGPGADQPVAAVAPAQPTAEASQEPAAAEATPESAASQS